MKKSIVGYTRKSWRGYFTSINMTDSEIVIPLIFMRKKYANKYYVGDLKKVRITIEEIG